MLKGGKGYDVELNGTSNLYLRNSQSSETNRLSTEYDTDQLKY